MFWHEQYFHETDCQSPTIYGCALECVNGTSLTLTGHVPDTAWSRRLECVNDTSLTLTGHVPDNVWSCRRDYSLTIKQLMESDSEFAADFKKEYASTGIEWAAEMFGYNYASAHAGVRHKVVRDLQASVRSLGTPRTRHGRVTDDTTLTLLRWCAVCRQVFARSLDTLL